MTNEILATVTDEEAEQLLKGRKIMDEALELRVKAILATEEANALEDEALRIKRDWGLAMKEKYNISEEVKIQFDSETKTLLKMEKMEKPNIKATLTKILELLKESKGEKK